MSALQSGIIGLVLSAGCLIGCQAPPPAHPIVLHPPHEPTYRTTARRPAVARPTPSVPASTAQACRRPSASVARAEQEEIFRQFEDDQGSTSLTQTRPGPALGPAPPHSNDACHQPG